MSLEKQIQKDLVKAMKSKDKARVRALRAVKSEILLANTDGSKESLTEEKEIKILQKLIKSRQESLSIYEKENRDDLAKKEKEEIEVISEYLPKALSDEEVEAQVEKIIEDNQAESMSDMGKVMGIAQKMMAGKVQGSKLADIVKSRLMK